MPLWSRASLAAGASSTAADTDARGRGGVDGDDLGERLPADQGWVRRKVSTSTVAELLRGSHDVRWSRTKHEYLAEEAGTDVTPEFLP